LTNAKSLSKVSVELTTDDDIISLKNDMIESLNSTDGSGIAAPQIGIFKRAIFVKELLKDGSTRNVFVVNPKIIASSGHLKLWEFCLSVPNAIGKVDRPSKITIVGFDENFNPIEITSSGTFAGLFQHEVEHLNGVLYIDRAIEIKKSTNDLENQQNRKIVLEQKIVF